MLLSTKSALFGGSITFGALLIGTMFPKSNFVILFIWLVLFILGVSNISKATLGK